ncbi:hypothetical protein [Aliikangiella sp. G2MR2-5]|uniref:hypothetical protein n=1 Tax=Aliikangiella sp. G2MR2-5 TaxID=2788943 RepID=UPI0018A9B7A9|nr:hypothetical protein [Aliikangiella sp. G2MR2-5]
MKKPRLSLSRLGLIALLSWLSLGAHAQTQPVKVTQQSQKSVSKPGHGQSMEQVEAQFGEPLEKFAPVGEPPIIRWRYSEFTVYFEHDKVIHAVVHQS